ncbi:hypothetical protein C8R43DRAFT_846283, partial [Mycena crocata]
MEIGSPMASMYVLGNPDHYTSHSYVNFWWKGYVRFVRTFWTESDDRMDMGDKDVDESVPLGKQDGEFVGSSSVDDYRYRPAVFENLSVYEWTQCYDKKIRTKKEREQ